MVVRSLAWYFLTGQIGLQINTNMKQLTFIFLLFSFIGFGQVQDSTLVAVDTSLAVKMKTKIEVVRNNTIYQVRQYNGDDVFTQVQIQGKRNAVTYLSDLLKRLNQDEANLLRELVIIRERKKEVRAARELYK